MLKISGLIRYVVNLEKMMNKVTKYYSLYATKKHTISN